MTAPGQTSRHSTGVSGSHLNIIANKTAIAASEMSEPKSCNAPAGACGPRYLAAADSAAVNRSDINSRKPSAMMAAAEAR